MMQLHDTDLPGVHRITAPAHEDARGSFRRSWCRETFASAGIDFAPCQASLSTNIRTHTLRGLHWQAAPHGEQKLVRCVAGTIWDVALDLRPDSPGFRRWYAAELSATNGEALFLPQGVAHGFITLTAETVVEYLIDAPHHPEAARGLRWDDPAFDIRWPVAPQVISERDRTWPGFGHG